MPSPSIPKFPNMVLIGNLWSARMAVPEQCRDKIGKAVLKFSTGESDPIVAYHKAKPHLEAWKRQIQDARGADAVSMTVAAQIEKVRAHVRAVQADGDPAIGASLWDHHIYPLLERLHAINGYDKSADVAVAEQVLGEATPIATYRAGWETTLSHKAARQQDQYKADLSQYLTWIGAGYTLEDADRLAERTQEWIDQLMTEGGAAGKTVARKLSVLQNYWLYMVSLKAVSGRVESPFRGRRIPQRKRQDPAKKRQPFTVEQVAQCYREALRVADQDLADLIKLAAYTGGRIEELAALEVSDVNLAGHVHTVILSSKTDAGHRVVPVMAQVQEILQRRIAAAQGGKFLFHVTGKNKYDERSAAVGKRFGTLKTRLGFDGRYVFHSIRKTVAGLFENAQCPEGVAADVIGHDKPTMTYGLYSGGSSLELRRDWMVKALVYPDL